VNLFLLFLAALTFNPDTVVTLPGTIASIEVIENDPPLLRMNLITSEGTIEVYLGPVSYLNHDQFPFRPDDRVEVTGSIVDAGGKRVMIASQLRKGHSYMRLRDAKGDWLVPN